MDNGAERDDNYDAPIMDETAKGMRLRLDRLERWRIAADIMIKENNHRLTDIDSHISTEFKDQNAEIKRRFETLHEKLEGVITDQRMLQVALSVLKWIALALGPIIAASWAVSTYIYDHYNRGGGK